MANSNVAQRHLKAATRVKAGHALPTACACADGTQRQGFGAAACPVADGGRLPRRLHGRGSRPAVRCHEVRWMTRGRRRNDPIRAALAASRWAPLFSNGGLLTL